MLSGNFDSRRRHPRRRIGDLQRRRRQEEPLHGALLTPGTIAGTDGSLGGSIDLQYSSQAVDILQSQLSDGVELVSWTQR